MQLRHDRETTAIELAGPDVLVLSQSYKDTLKLVAVPRVGGKARTLLELDEADYDSARLGASTQLVALAVDVKREHRLYVGPPSGPLKLMRKDRSKWAPGVVRVDGNRILLTELIDDNVVDFGGGDGEETGPRNFRASVYDGTRWTPIAWASGNRMPSELAGPYVAIEGYAPQRIELADLVTGASLYTIMPPTTDEGPQFGGLDLLPDGRIAVNTRRGIDLAGIGQPVSNLANSGRLGNPFFAGPYIATFDDARKTLDLVRGDGSQIVLQPASFTEGDIAADDNGVAWLLNGCVRYASFAPSTASRATPCPGSEISLYFIGAHSKLRGNHARVPVKCVAAASGRCRGTLLLREGRSKPVLGRGTFSLPPDIKHDGYVRVTFTAAAVAKFKRKGYGSLIVDARVKDGTVTTLDGIGDFEFDVEVD
ncbi:hypothetical protein OJ998_02340 [Solirubrobacter taibaiensis]|nr:hypothetical protein [Solirubrobacter taibaiensis]